MYLGETSSQQPSGDMTGADWQEALVARTWQATLISGVLSVILGIVVAFHPSGSLNLIAVLIGILMVISGAFHLGRVFTRTEPHRVWLGIAGLAFVVIGVVLIRHLHLTLAVIGLVVGINWIIQGLVTLLDGASVGPGEGRGWLIFFGAVSLIAGIVAVAAPLSSLTALAVLIGIWFAVIGLYEIIWAFVLRRARGPARASVPGGMQAAP